jgi:mannose-6-phosphate isomerase-like protein (cupin superfamily)
MTASGRGLVLNPGEGRRVGVALDTMTFKGAGDDDRFSVVEYESAAGMPGPPPHIHHRNEEAFYILDGQVDFMLDGKTERLDRGSFVLVPRGTTHTFVNAGPGPARWIGIFAPGHYEQLVEEVGAILPKDAPPDGAALAALFTKWDTEIATDVRA